MKTIMLMGLEIKDLSVRECLHMTGEFLKNGSLNVIYFLSGQALLSAEDSEELRQLVKDADIVLPDTTDILHAAGTNNRSREKEIERNLFLKGFFRICSRDKKRIFIIADSEEREKAIRSAVSMIQKDLNFVGTYILTDADDAENAVNEVNSVAPDIVLSVVRTPLHEEFIYGQKMKINSKLFVAMTPAMLKLREDGTINNKGFLDRLKAGFFNKAVQKYKEKEK